MTAVPVDLEAARQRYDDHMALWAGSVEAMHGPFTAAGAVTCAAAASAADVPDLRAEIGRLRDLVEDASREKFRQGVELGETIDQRDDAEKWADRLADAAAMLTGKDMGEHSNANNRWANALEALIEHARRTPGEVR